MDEQQVRELFFEQLEHLNPEAEYTSSRHPDYVMEMPRSGERRIRGRENMRAFQEAYPNPPTIEPRRVVGSGDVWVVEARSDYGEGQRFNVAKSWSSGTRKIWKDTRYRRAVRAAGLARPHGSSPWGRRRDLGAHTRSAVLVPNLTVTVSSSVPRTTRRVRVWSSPTWSRASWSSSASLSRRPPASTSRSPVRRPAWSARSALLDQQAVPLGQAHRLAQLPGHPGRGDADAEPGPGRGLAPAEGVEALAQLGVGRQGQVEPVAQPVGVDAEQPAFGVDRGAPGA